MRVSGYLVPFPDHGAADLMSDHLEQQIHADGPGTLELQVTVPKTVSNRPSEGAYRFARKQLKVMRRDGEEWVPLVEATTDTDNSSESFLVEVLSPGRLLCRLTNMSGIEGQFTLECTFRPDKDDER